MISSTVSNESAPKSFVKLASVTTSFSSTPNLSTIIAFTLDAMSDIISKFLILIVGKNKKLYSKSYNIMVLIRVIILFFVLPNLIFHEKDSAFCFWRRFQCGEYHTVF